MKVNAKSPIHTELQDFYYAIQLTWEQQLYPLKVETDAMQVINFINYGCVTYKYLINNCRWLMSKMDTLVIRHSFDQGNEIAYLLANEATRKLEVNKLSRLAIPPLCVLTRMLADKSGNAFVKTIFTNSCRLLAKLGNIIAMHAWPLKLMY